MSNVEKASLTKGERVEIGKNQFEVVNVVPVDPCLKNVIQMMKETGKEPFYYDLAKISPITGKLLKSGGGRYMLFTKTKNLIKWL